jgi:hypothetical protein
VPVDVPDTVDINNKTIPEQQNGKTQGKLPVERSDSDSEPEALALPVAGAGNRRPGIRSTSSS